MIYEKYGIEAVLSKPVNTEVLKPIIQEIFPEAFLKKSPTFRHGSQGSTPTVQAKTFLCEEDFGRNHRVNSDVFKGSSTPGSNSLSSKGP